MLTGLLELDGIERLLVNGIGVTNHLITLDGLFLAASLAVKWLSGKGGWAQCLDIGPEQVEVALPQVQGALGATVHRSRSAVRTVKLDRPRSWSVDPSTMGTLADRGSESSIMCGLVSKHRSIGHAMRNQTMQDTTYII